jgi:multidrug resistance efflux pump
VAALGYWYFILRPTQKEAEGLTASGAIEVLQIQISAELGGKVSHVNAAEGDLVKAGDILVQLDPSLLEAQRLQAAAGLETAEANARASQSNADAARFSEEAAQAGVEAAQESLNLLDAGASADQIAASKAQLALAEANRQAAEASLAALTAGVRPEEVTVTRLSLDLAREAYYSLTLVLSSQQITDVTSAQIASQANMQASQALLDELKRDTAMPDTALQAASSAVRDASAAYQCFEAALTSVNDPTLPFYRHITILSQCLELAQRNLNQARADQDFLIALGNLPQPALDAADELVKLAQDLAESASAAYTALDSSPQGERLRAAWLEVQGALSRLNGLARGGAAPLETILDQLDSAYAQTDLANANLNSIQSGARQEQIQASQAQLEAAQAQLAAAQARTQAALSQAEAAQAQVDLAQAALAVLDVQISKFTITAPTDGILLTRIIQPGELAAPGAALLILGQAAEKTITVYIPEDRYGLITLGQIAEVSVDSFPEIRFKAEVIHIADQAEFTPRNVQTVEGRKNTVFAIKLSVEDPDGRLKDGMPADVSFK